MVIGYRLLVIELGLLVIELDDEMDNEENTITYYSDVSDHSNDGSATWYRTDPG